MTFVKWVSHETVLRAYFNEWEPSLGIEKNSRSYTVYHSKYPDTDINLVIIEGFRDHKDGYPRCELFFRSFSGKSSGECRTLEEAEPFFEELKKTVSRKYLVPGRKLEGRILEAVDELEQLS